MLEDGCLQHHHTVWNTAPRASTSYQTQWRHGLASGSGNAVPVQHGQKVWLGLWADVWREAAAVSQNVRCRRPSVGFAEDGRLAGLEFRHGPQLRNSMLCIERSKNSARFVVQVELPPNEKMRPPIKSSSAPVVSVLQMLQECGVIADGDPGGRFEGGPTGPDNVRQRMQQIFNENNNPHVTCSLESFSA